MTIYALLNPQGTACAETALCGLHYSDENLRTQAEQYAEADRLPDSAIPGTWTDCTDNEALTCQACGARREES
jgi:hypothetical protein